MTTYHVWLTGQVRPEVVRADAVFEAAGYLEFYDLTDRVAPTGDPFVRTVRDFAREEWQRWAVVQDDADLQHL